MQISLKALIPTLFFTSSVLAQGKHRSYSDSYHCNQFNSIFHPHEEKLLSTHHNITFSNPTREDGAAHCCELCYQSPHNCMLAQYDVDRSVCQMSIIKKASKLLDPAELELKAQCPFGISRDGDLDDTRLGSGLYMEGPCWSPHHIIE